MRGPVADSRRPAAAHAPAPRAPRRGSPPHRGASARSSCATGSAEVASRSSSITPPCALAGSTSIDWQPGAALAQRADSCAAAAASRAAAPGVSIRMQRSGSASMRAGQLLVRDHGLDAHAEHAAEAAQLLVRAESLIIGGDHHQVGRVLLEHIARRELRERRGLAGTRQARSAPARRARCNGGATGTWILRASIAYGMRCSLVAGEHRRQVTDDLQRQRALHALSWPGRPVRVP